MITVSSDDAPGDTTNQITQVIQTVLAAQLVNGSFGQPPPPANGATPAPGAHGLRGKARSGRLRRPHPAEGIAEASGVE